MESERTDWSRRRNHGPKSEREYHHDYYYSPEGMTERNDWRQTTSRPPEAELHDRRPDGIWKSVKRFFGKGLKN